MKCADFLLVSVPTGFPNFPKEENGQFLTELNPRNRQGEAILSRNCQARDQKRKFWLNSNKGTKCDIEICDSRALFGEFKCAASESWTPPASLPIGLPAGQSP